MLVPFLLVISIVACLLCGIIKKYYTTSFSNGSKELHFYNALTSIFAVITFLIWGSFQQNSLFTAILGVLFGIVTTLQMFFSLKAMRIGSWSYTTVIISLAMLLPTVSGWIFFNEPIGWTQIVGIILLIICLFLSTDFKSSKSKKISIKWLIYCLIAFFATGGIGILQKIHQSSIYKGELDLFLVFAFCFSFVFAVVFWRLACVKENKQKTKLTVSEQTKKEFVNNKKPKLKLYGVVSFTLLAISGIFIAVNNKLNLFLSGEMESAIFFPLVNGGNLILTTVIAVLLFKEKLNKKQWFGLIVGMISVILLCNPFG